MKKVYRIIVKPYSYDHWSIFTEDKEVFNMLSPFDTTEQVIGALGADVWEEIVESYLEVKHPYVLLDEITLHQQF